MIENAEQASDLYEKVTRESSGDIIEGILQELERAIRKGKKSVTYYFNAESLPFKALIVGMLQDRNFVVNYSAGYSNLIEFWPAYINVTFE